MTDIYEKIKAKKPFWIPKFVWNKAVNLACDASLEYANVDKVGEVIANGVVQGVAKAVNGKNDETVATVCTIAEKGSNAFSKISAAAKDKTITAEEQAEIASSIGEVVASFVEQDEVNAKIEEARCALLCF